VLWEVPQPLKSLLESDQSDAKSFWNNTRQYNSALAFTSLSAKFYMSLLQGNGPYVLKLHGELYHNLGALIPGEDREASYAQLYIYDSIILLLVSTNRQLRDSEHKLLQYVNLPAKLWISRLS
jgi:hypothetical protein